MSHTILTKLYSLSSSYTIADTEIYLYQLLQIKKTAEDFALLHRLLFEIYAPKTYEMFVCEHSETIEYVKK